MKRSAEYVAWQNMKRRCDNKNHPWFHNYGGRGIRVCKRWLHSFINFIEDMGTRPHGLTLDRIDVDGDYEPSNCRWASRLEQTRNRRQRGLVYYKFNGSNLCLVEWAEKKKISKQLLHWRIKHWGINRALSDER